MNRKRIVFTSKLKADMVEKYIDLHNNIPEELIKIYKDNGILNITCFINDTTLICYQEFDVEKYEKNKDAIAVSQASIDFMKSLEGVDDVKEVQLPGEFVEVFHME